MKQFHVYRHPTQGAEAVKVGFSWPAFFFGFFWMLAKKLWSLAAMWIAAYVVCLVVESLADSSSAQGSKLIIYLLLMVAYFSLWLVPAFKGNRWREEKLRERGFVLVGATQAENPDAAAANMPGAA
jgi:predicted permease